MEGLKLLAESLGKQDIKMDWSVKGKEYHVSLTYANETVGFARHESSIIQQTMREAKKLLNYKPLNSEEGPYHKKNL